MTNPKSTLNIGGHPVHIMLVAFPIASFVGTLAVDIAFLNTNNPFWFTASLWLLRVGLVLGIMAAATGLVDFLGDRRVRDLTAAWVHFLGNAAIVVIQFVNWYMRTSPAQVSSLFYLSAFSVVILLVTGWMGWTMVYRHRVSVRD
jgi:uncharacterized membrane protein